MDVNPSAKADLPRVLGVPAFLFWKKRSETLEKAEPGWTGGGGKK
ncbi:MAG TPA: hypothetical protein VHP61_03765 [Acidobacteriota bacterium]|nr:hypothetical protein [Acidobacteriota bacterium]